MIRLMVNENATQSGSKAAAVMNEVDAVLRRLVKPILWAGDLATVVARWPEIAQCFQSRGTYEKAHRHLMDGAGIGEANHQGVAPARLGRWSARRRLSRDKKTPPQ